MRPGPPQAILSGFLALSPTSFPASSPPQVAFPPLLRVLTAELAPACVCTCPRRWPGHGPPAGSPPHPTPVSVLTRPGPACRTAVASIVCSAGLSWGTGLPGRHWDLSLDHPSPWFVFLGSGASLLGADPSLSPGGGQGDGDNLLGPLRPAARPALMVDWPKAPVGRALFRSYTASGRSTRFTSGGSQLVRGWGPDLSLLCKFSFQESSLRAHCAFSPRVSLCGQGAEAPLQGGGAPLWPAGSPVCRPWGAGAAKPVPGSPPRPGTRTSSLGAATA